VTTNVVTLTQVRTHLRYPNPTASTSDDGELQIFINAADQVIRFECDDSLPTAYSERHDGGDYSIFLRHKPVLSVQNVEEGWGWINYELDFQDANTPPAATSLFGYSIDNHEVGEIARRSVASVPIPFRPGENNIYIQYTAGRSPIPGNIVLAELELIAHWWQNSQLRGVIANSQAMSYDATSGTTFSRDTENGVQNINIGVPYRILELIKGNRHMPIFA